MSKAKRTAKPELSAPAQACLMAFEEHLGELEDMQAGTIRNYLSDLRLFVAWFEQQNSPTPFSPGGVTTPALVRYRTYLQTTAGLKPSSVNRSLMSLKRYFQWAGTQGLLKVNPAQPVKMVAVTVKAPPHLSDREEESFLAAVNKTANLRDRTLITLLLHTGLRAREVCLLKREHLKLAERSGTLTIVGKGNKYREVPLNATVRQVLKLYLPQLAEQAIYLFPSEKTGTALTERALGHLIKKYARQAGLPTLSPHHLRHRFGYRMAQTVSLQRLAQIMGHTSLDTTMLYIAATAEDLQNEVEKIAWN